MDARPVQESPSEQRLRALEEALCKLAAGGSTPPGQPDQQCSHDPCSLLSPLGGGGIKRPDPCAYVCPTPPTIPADIKRPDPCAYVCPTPPSIPDDIKRPDPCAFVCEKPPSILDDQRPNQSGLICNVPTNVLIERLKRNTEPSTKVTKPQPTQIVEDPCLLTPHETDVYTSFDIIEYNAITEQKMRTDPEEYLLGRWPIHTPHQSGTQEYPHPLTPTEHQEYPHPLTPTEYQEYHPLTPTQNQGYPRPPDTLVPPDTKSRQPPPSTSNPPSPGSEDPDDDDDCEICKIMSGINNQI